MAYESSDLRSCIASLIYDGNACITALGMAMILRLNRSLLSLNFQSKRFECGNLIGLSNVAHGKSSPESLPAPHVRDVSSQHEGL